MQTLFSWWFAKLIYMGKLFLCATPIGNLEDITFRVIKTLKEVDLIAAEDTRHSIKLLNHFEIKTPMTSYHEHNKVEKARVIVDKLLAGLDIALITDAGTPGISDPGEELVKQAVMAGIEVTSLPGAAACITALTMSGLGTRRFVFEAFLPTDKKEREFTLKEMQMDTRTIVMYEAPHRLLKTLKELFEILGDRKISFCREITKRYEEVLRCTISEGINHFSDVDPKGEFVLVIEGKDRADIIENTRKQWEEITIEEHYQTYLNKGMERKEAMKAVAKDRGLSKREIYGIINGI